MDTSTLAAKIAAGSPSAAGLAREIGPAARPVALVALKAPEAQSRRVAIYCLESINDPSDLPAVAAMLSDPDPNVQLTAAAAVRRMHVAAIGQGQLLLDAFDAASNPAIKAELALALGERLDPPSAALEKRWKDEKNPAVKTALRAALARRGDARALHQLQDELGRAKGDKKKHAIEETVYVDRKALLPALVKRLGDGEVLLEITPHHLPAPLRQRASDLAAWAIGQITGTLFSFAEGGFAGLSKAQLDEARQAAEKAIGEGP